MSSPIPAAVEVPVPPEDVELEAEERLALRARDQNIANLALTDIGKVKDYLEALRQGLEIMQGVAIKSTTPYDWTRYKDREGKVTCILRDQGATTIRKWLGISITGHRGHPTDLKEPGPKVSTERVKQADGKAEVVVTIVEMWADGFCARTGERVEGIYSAIRSDQKFRGRETPQDDKASIRTYLDTKVTRILSGLRKVPEDVLKGAGLETEKCYGGSGFGTSAERQAGAVAEEGVGEKAKALGEEVLRRVGGDVSAARQLLVEITSWTNKEGMLVKGYDSVSKLTKGFQVENAWKKLRAHKTFGDAAQRDSGPEDEPGAEG